MKVAEPSVIPLFTARVVIPWPQRVGLTRTACFISGHARSAASLPILALAFVDERPFIGVTHSLVLCTFACRHLLRREYLADFNSSWRRNYQSSTDAKCTREKQQMYGVVLKFGGMTSDRSLAKYPS